MNILIWNTPREIDDIITKIAYDLKGRTEKYIPRNKK